MQSATMAASAMPAAAPACSELATDSTRPAAPAAMASSVWRCRGSARNSRASSAVRKGVAPNTISTLATGARPSARMKAIMLPASAAALANSAPPPLRMSIQVARHCHSISDTMAISIRIERQNDTSHAGSSTRRTITPAVLKAAAALTAQRAPTRPELSPGFRVFMDKLDVKYGVDVPPSIDSLDLPPFRPRFPWWGPDLQTLAVLLQSSASDLSPHASERVCFPMADRTGDILLGMLDRPEEPMAGRPLVVLIHGLTGCEDSVYILSAARHLCNVGYTVLRLNVRGAGPSRAYCGEHYHVGRTADFRRVLWQLPEELTKDGVVAIGYSCGGTMLLKYLGEEGSFSSLRAAATICAPIDLVRNARHMLRPRNWFYHNFILNGMKAEALGEGARVS